MNEWKIRTKEAVEEKDKVETNFNAILAKHKNKTQTFCVYKAQTTCE